MGSIAHAHAPHKDYFEVFFEAHFTLLNSLPNTSPDVTDLLAVLHDGFVNVSWCRRFRNARRLWFFWNRRQHNSSALHLDKHFSASPHPKFFTQLCWYDNLAFGAELAAIKVCHTFVILRLMVNCPLLLCLPIPRTIPQLGMLVRK